MKIPCKVSFVGSRLFIKLWPRVNGGYLGPSEGSNNSGLVVVDEPRPVALAYNSFQRIASNGSEELPPLMFLHGFYGRRRQFRKLGVALHSGCNGRRKVYLLDARNHGESPHTLSHTVEDQVADVLQFMRVHDIQQAALVGHSMGARTAMAIALKYPNLVEGCVLIDASASPPTVTGTTKLFFDALRSVAVPPVLNANDGRQFADRQLRRLLPHKIQRDFVLDNLVKTSSGSFDWQLNWRTLETLHDSNRKFLLPQNVQYFGPTLFVKGAHSNEMDPQQLLNTRRLFPLSTFRIIQESGHLVHIEQPRKLQKILMKFIDTSSPDRAKI